jgi:hypothetical protein
MAEKRTATTRTKNTKTSTSAKHAGGEDLRAQIARRAYEISQSDAAASEEENWLRAEREVTGGHAKRA